MTLEKCSAILDKILECALYGLAFFIPVSIALTEIFTATAIAAFVLKKILGLRPGSLKENRGASFLAPANIFLLLFFVFCALSMVHSGPYIHKSLNALLGKWGKFLILYWAAASSLGTEKRLRNITLVFLASAALVILDAYSQKFFGLEFLLHRPMIDINFGGHTELAVTGAFKHPNDFAAYLICVLPLLAGLVTAIPRPENAKRLSLKDSVILSPKEGEGSRSGFFSRRGRDQNDGQGSFRQPVRETFHRASLVVVICLLVLCLILTFSRGGWLGFIVAGILMVLLFPEKKFFLFIAALFILALLVMPGIPERMVASFGAGGDSGRYQLWDGAWAMIAEHPFLGKGVGTFMAFSQDYIRGRGDVYAHNCFLQMWAEVGVLGLLIFLLFLGRVFRCGFRAIRCGAWGWNSAALAGLLCGTVAFLVQSVLDTNFYALQPSALFWLFLGMIAASSQPRITTSA